jgi:hypothetical protein
MFEIYLYAYQKENSHLHIQLIVNLNLLNKIISCQLFHEECTTCLTSFQCLRVGAELYLVSKLTENARSGRVCNTQIKKKKTFLFEEILSTRAFNKSL